MSYILGALKRYNYKHLNIRLIIWVCALTTLGVFVIASATDSDLYEKKQLLGFILGIIVMVITALISYQFILRFYTFFYAINLILLLAVKFLGANHMGAKRWIDLGFIQLQPSEFTKIFLIIFFAAFFEKFSDRINTLPMLGSSIGLFVVPWLLVLSQPDLSTSIVIGVLFVSMIYVAGLSYKIIGIALAVTVPVAIIIIYILIQPNQSLLEGYQLNRINAWLHPEDARYRELNRQQDNSVMAVGSGGLWGKGLNNNTTTSVKNGKYLSEPQTDFIFCIVGEELGFIGTTGVIILLILIVIECFYIGGHAPDLAGRIIACGFGFLIATQSFVNIGVVTRVLPNTGLPLPFVSYGLSSLLSLFLSVGIVLNIALQRRDS